jgi:Zn-finger nucleic acid-binding protein
MACCQNCSAPLPANSLVCLYCGTRNDIDLRGNHYTIINPQTDRLCPACDIPLQGIQIHLESSNLAVERCPQCFGLFFDPGEIEQFLAGSMSEVFGSNLVLLNNINADRYQKDKPVRYLKCPVCQFLMNREAFGYRSGVVVDQCHLHGIWVDGGEIRHLLEWRKAGGQLLHEQHEWEKQHQAKIAATHPVDNEHWLTADSDFSSILRRDEHEGSGLFDAVASLIFRLFKTDY